MTSNTAQKSARKPGRPPLGKRPLTVAQIKRRYRDRKRLQGVREISLMVDQRHFELIEELAASSGLSKRQTMQLILDGAMHRVELGNLAGLQVKQAGGTPDEIHAAVRHAMEHPNDGIDQEGGRPLTSK